MSTSYPTKGGPAIPAHTDTSGKTMGRVALRCYGFSNAAGAVAGGFRAEAGPAMSVYQVTQAQLDEGLFVLEGDPKATPIYTAPDGMAVEGGFAQPIFIVNP